MKPLRLDFGEKQGFFLCSDLHIGSASVDYRLLRKEFDDAVRNGDRIYINGDVVDAIFPQDRKRFRPSCIVKELQGRDDMGNALLDYAESILAPYANHIDAIGTGNHDDAVSKHHNFDIISLIVERLQKYRSPALPPIQYIGYYGVLLIPFRDSRGKSNGSLDILFHHGAGGGGPVTLGMIDFNRAASWAGERSIIWMGHTHDKNNNEGFVLCMNQSGDAYLKPRRYIRTGAYYDPYLQPSQDFARDGRKSQYAADTLRMPKGKGGARLEVTSARQRGLEMKVTQ